MGSIAAVVAVVLAFAQPSEAKIVYTPANVSISGNYNLDLSNNGRTDFTISNPSRSFCSPYYEVFERPASGNGAISNGTFPAALMQGAPIGHGRSFYGGRQTMASATRLFPRCAFSVDGPWADVLDRYLGLSFRRNGRTHYGWARLSVKFYTCCYFAATLTGYAYETIAGKSIKAGQQKEAADDPTNDDFGPGASLSTPIPDNPQPGSLGMLALGAQGVPLWRRKESAVEGDFKGALL